MPERRPLRATLGWAAAALAYAAAALAITWPIAFEMARKAAYFKGDTCLNAYILAWGRHALVSDPLGAFDANFFHPFPGSIALSENLFGVSALLVPLFPIQNPILAYNLLLLASFPLNGLALCWALRRWGAAPAAAWIGGFMFAFLPWRFSQLGHIQTLFTWWLPIGAAGIEAWARRGSWRGAGLAAVAVAASFYTCVYHAIFLALFGAAFGVAAFLGEAGWRSRLRGMAAQLAGAGALAAALVAPALPSYIEARRVLGEVNAIESLLPRGAALSDYARASDFNLLFKAASIPRPPNPYSDIHWEHQLFLGFVPIALAGSLALAPRFSSQGSAGEKRPFRGIAMPLAAASAWMFVVSLGPELHWMGKATGVAMPYRALHAWLPGMQSIRVPARAALAVGMGLAALAAMAIHVWAELAARRARRLAGALAAVVAALSAAECLNQPIHVEANPTYERVLKAQLEIAKRPRGAIVALPFDEELIYASFLSTWPHFYPTTCGRSGYLFNGTTQIERALSANEWGQNEAGLLRWLGARYLLLDMHKTAAPSPEALRALPDRLRSLGFSVSATEFEAEGIALLEIESLETPRAEPIAKAEFDVAKFIVGEEDRREIAIFLASRHPHFAVPDDARWLEATAKGHGGEAEPVWTRKLRFRMPPFMLRGQTVTVHVPVEGARAEGVKRVTIRLELPSLLYKEKVDVWLEEPK